MGGQAAKEAGRTGGGGGGRQPSQPPNPPARLQGGEVALGVAQGVKDAARVAGDVAWWEVGGGWGELPVALDATL